MDQENDDIRKRKLCLLLALAALTVQIVILQILRWTSQRRKMGLFNAMCTSTVRLDGKTAVVTGCNTGIGKETAQDFYLRGAKVIMACRNVKKANTAKKYILQECVGEKNVGKLHIVELDLSSLKSVRHCAENLLENEDRIDLLINNAGVMVCEEGKTEDGFEIHFGTNHLGHFLFTMLLLPKICNQNTPARIVNVSSLAHLGSSINFKDMNYNKRSYSRTGAYGQSKLANILFTRELARRLERANVRGVTTYSLHPGVIITDIGRTLDDAFCPGTKWLYKNLGKWFLKDAKQGAQTTIYCAVDPKCASESGKFYRECGVSRIVSRDLSRPEITNKLWEESLVLVGLDKNFDPFLRN